MKIIKPGNPRAERKFRTDCATCEARIEFSEREGKVVRDSRDGDYIQVKCPCCSSPITVAL